MSLSARSSKLVLAKSPPEIPKPKPQSSSFATARSAASVVPNAVSMRSVSSFCCRSWGESGGGCVSSLMARHPKSFVPLVASWRGASAASDRS